MKKYVLIISILIANSYLLVSKEFNRENYSFSIGLGLNNSWNQVDFKQLSEIENCCPEYFNNSFSNNIVGDISFRKFYNNYFAYFFNIGIVNYNDNFESFESIITKDGFSRIKHSMDLNLLFIQNRFGLSNKINNFGLSYGILAESNIIKKYSQKEELIEPLSATFENDLRIRNVFKNKNSTYINNFNFGVFTQLWLEFYFDKYKLKALSPYIEINYMFNNYHRNSNFNKINLTIGVQYRIIFIKDYDTPLVPIN